MNEKLRLFFLLAVMLLALACTREGPQDGNGDIYADGPVEARITAGVATRADGGYWTADQIGVMVTEPTEDNMADYLNVGYETEAEGTAFAAFSAVDEDNPICFTQSGDVTFAAYAPWDGGTATQLPGSNGVFTCDTESQTSADTQSALDWLWATGTGSFSQPDVSFAFTHVMARINVTIIGLGSFTVSDVQGGTYTLGGISHEGTFDAVTGETAATGDPVSDWSLEENCVTTDTDEGVTFSAIIFPQSPDELPFYAKIGNYTAMGYDLMDELDGDSLEAGCSYDFTIRITPYDVASTSVKTRRL